MGASLEAVNWARRGLTLAAVVCLAAGLLAFFLGSNTLLASALLLLALWLAALAAGALKGDPGREGSGFAFLSRWLALSLIVAALVMGFNFVVNPYGIYPTRIYQPIVLTSRWVKIHQYEAYDPPPEIVVLGSSKSFTVSPEEIKALTGMSAFNASMHGAFPEDLLGFTRFIYRRGDHPGTVLFLASPEMFVRDGNQVPEANEPLAAYVDGKSPLVAGLEQLGLMLSRQQVEASFRLLQAEREGRSQPAYEFSPDGQATFHVPGTLDERLVAYLEGGWGASYWDVPGVVPRQVEFYRQAVALASENGARVVLYVPPFHPRAEDVYSGVARYREVKAGMMELLADLAREYGAEVFDFTDLASFGGSPSMFIDAVHPNPEASARMMRVVFGPGAD